MIYLEPALVLGTRKASWEGRMWISSHDLQTSIPTVDLVLVSCSDRSLPCMRDLLPIICSGQEPRGGRTTLTDGALSQGGTRSHPLAPWTAAARPGAQSL